MRPVQEGEAERICSCLSNLHSSCHFDRHVNTYLTAVRLTEQGGNASRHSPTSKGCRVSGVLRRLCTSSWQLSKCLFNVKHDPE